MIADSSPLLGAYLLFDDVTGLISGDNLHG